MTRTDPPLAADEVSTLCGFLDHQRETLRMKTAGLTAAQLATPHPPATMTLGGLLKHMALVEDFWFGVRVAGHDPDPRFAAVDWDADPDWEWHSAAEDTPGELVAMWDAAVERSRGVLAEVLAEGDPGSLCALPSRNGEHVSLRWVLCHMVEEYARHNGHADLIRESIDGATGE